MGLSCLMNDKKSIEKARKLVSIDITLHSTMKTIGLRNNKSFVQGNLQ